MSRRKRREFTDEFKIQVVSLYNSGKPRSEIIRQYDLTSSQEENEILKLQKQIKQFKMENDILKQAALIMAQK